MNLNAILAMLSPFFGGIPGIVAGAVSTLTKGKVDLTVPGIEAGADRMLTISQKDVYAACDRLRITAQADRDKAVQLFQIAGDKLGDAAAFLAEKSSHLA